MPGGSINAGGPRTLVREAERRGASEIVVADPASCGLARRERHRLQTGAPANP
jgi:hypothetical protein